MNKWKYRKYDLSRVRYRQTAVFPLPTKRECDLIIAYSNYIVRMRGEYEYSPILIYRAPANYYSIVFNSVRKIPYYVVTGVEREDLMVLSSFVNVMVSSCYDIQAILQISSTIPNKQKEVFTIVNDVITELMEDAVIEQYYSLSFLETERITSLPHFAINGILGGRLSIPCSLSRSGSKAIA